MVLGLGTLTRNWLLHVRSRISQASKKSGAADRSSNYQYVFVKAFDLLGHLDAHFTLPRPLFLVRSRLSSGAFASSALGLEGVVCDSAAKRKMQERLHDSQRRGRREPRLVVPVSALCKSAKTRGVLLRPIHKPREP